MQRRLGELAGLIVACDALVAWCAGLIDRGYRGEMECIVAKIFGSEAQKHAAVEYFMKTHGGRSFLHGHNFGDNIHEYLAPCIYEGEGEMLGMGFFKSLVKHHGKTYFEPIGKALAAAGIRQPNPMNPAHMWALKNVALPYLKWVAARRLRPLAAAQLPDMPKPLREHAEFACERLQRMALGNLQHDEPLSVEAGRPAVPHGGALAALPGCDYDPHDEHVRRTPTRTDCVQDAADILCENLRQKLLGRRPSNHYFRRVTELGAAIAEGQFRSIAGIEADEILMPYEQ